MQFPLEILSSSPFVIAILDSTALTLFIAPLLFTFVYKPMQSRIHELQNNYKQLVHAQHQHHIYFSAIQETSEAVMVTGMDGTIIAVNPAVTQLTGYSEQELIGSKPTIFSSGNHSKAFYEVLWSSLVNDGHWHGELHNRKKSGEFYIQYSSISKVLSNQGEPHNFVSVFHDITHQKAEEEHLRFHAQHDFLTGLPNRTLFIDRLNQIIANTRKNKNRSAVLFLDLDRFKPINDTHGHAVGDQLLVAVAIAIKEKIRREDTISRIGGDEFTIILRSITQKEDAGLLASKILETFAQPFLIAGKSLSVGVSIGIAIFPDHANSLEKLLEMADSAMYTVKQSGRNNFRYFQAVAR